VAQPTPYERAYDFEGFQAANPNDPLPANKIHDETDALELTLGQIIANLALLQRDDGKLKNGIVTPDSLKRPTVNSNTGRLLAVVPGAGSSAGFFMSRNSVNLDQFDPIAYLDPEITGDVLSGAAAPLQSTGENGDHYYATTPDTLYFKRSDDWVVIGVCANLVPTGDAITGNGSPAGATGATGDVYVDLLTTRRWGKVAGNWVSIGYSDPLSAATNIVFVATYDDAVALADSGSLDRNAVVCTNCREEEDDGGFGFWQYRPESTEDENGGTVLEAGLGRIHRLDDSAEVHAAWFGVRGSASPADNAAVLAVAYAFVRESLRNILVLPPGVIQTSSFPIIQPEAGQDFISNIIVRGQGGAHTYNGTRLWFTGTSGSFIQILSANNILFEDLEIVAPNAAWDFLLKIDTAGVIPFYSSFDVTFKRVRFGITDAGTNTKTHVRLANCGPVTFEDCRYQGALNSVLIGTPTADNAGTYGGGAASQITWDRCFFQGDIKNGRGDTIQYRECLFDANPAASGRGVRIYGTGDERMRNVTFIDCWSDFSDGGTPGVFYTQGSNDKGLLVLGGRVGADYTGGYYVHTNGEFRGVLFRSSANNFRGIEISAGAQNISYSGLINECTGTAILSGAALAIGSTVQNVANGAFNYQIAGVNYSKAAVAAGTAPGNDVVPAGLYGAVAFDINSAGTITAVEAPANATGYASAVAAAAALPAVGASLVRMGYVTATKSDGAFTFGTTALNAANTTVAYTSTAAGGTAMVYDARSVTDGATASSAPLAVNKLVTADTPVASGGSFVDVATAAWTPQGGEFRVMGCCTVTMGASAGKVTVRIITDALFPRVLWQGNLAANEVATIVLPTRLGVWTAGVGFAPQTVKMQVANESANTITAEADAAPTPSFMQIIERW
jgi:hypothetical protein